PRPSFILQVPLRRERLAAQAPPVRLPMVTQSVPAVAVVGRVLGPREIPIAGAFVELPSLDLVTQTDANGRFQFSQVPAQPRAKQLRVRGKGLVQSFVAEPDKATNLITLRLPIKED